MKIITNNSNKPIPFSVGILINRVFDDYDLWDWEIEFWTIKNENECIDDMKLIYLYNNPSPRKTKMLFLHEIVHALNSYKNPDFEDEMFHGQNFQKNLSFLLDKYRNYL